MSFFGRRVRAVAVVLAGTALLAGCGEDGSGSGTPGTTSAPLSASPTASGAASYPTEGGSSVSPELEPVVEAAVADLESRPGTGTGPVRVVLARPETFPDGAVGCPEPGKMYTQALVEGYRVVLARGDRSWLYTAAEDGVPRLCASGEKDGGRDFVPPPGKRD